MLSIRKILYALSLSIIIVTGCANDNTATPIASHDYELSKQARDDIQYVTYHDLYTRPDNYKDSKISFVGRVNHLYERKNKTMLTQTLYTYDANGNSTAIGDILWYTNGSTTLSIGDDIETIGLMKGSHFSFSHSLGMFWEEPYSFRTFSNIIPDQIPIMRLQYYQVNKSTVTGNQPSSPSQPVLHEAFYEAH